MKRKHYSRLDNAIALVLLGIVFVAVVALLIETLEAEVMIHGGQPSALYVRTLELLGIKNFVDEHSR